VPPRDPKLARNGIRLVTITPAMGDDPIHVMKQSLG